ncbi:uncharacterized protein LOC107690789 [Sinocyclocheilus anshuiensis]|uniref:uncharacterized protein LOC107690789 n=1 Tax=Sinocyclocheilus anshuiensis TaxID=1608454 RepID=UPI0007B9B60F|nr:PREDICTED: uncharacterized protein LOC107690789 [Sinocyclocheilus anshuiensis]
MLPYGVITDSSLRAGLRESKRVCGSGAERGSSQSEEHQKNQPEASQLNESQAYLDIQLHKTNRKILKAEKNRLEQKEIERHSKAYRDDTDQHLNAFRETSIAHLDAFLCSLRDCISTHHGEQCSGIQQNLSRIAQDQTRLQDVHSGFERLLQESDTFQFIKVHFTHRYLFILSKPDRPLFFPDALTVDTEPLFETMEGKMGEFIAELRQHTDTLLSTVCESETRSYGLFSLDTVPRLFYSLIYE